MALALPNLATLRQIDWQHPSDLFNPIFIKEIRQGLRAKAFVGPFTLIHVCMMIGLSLELLEVSAIGSGASSSFGTAFFWSVTCAFLLLTILFVGLMAVSKEVKGHHVELFRLAGVSRWRVVLGKWLALFLQSALIVVSIVPYMLLRYFIGGLELTESLGWLLLALTQSGNAIALALALSSFRSTMGRIFGMLYLPFTLMQNIGASMIAFAFQENLPEVMRPYLYVINAGLATLGSVVILLSIASGKIQLFERSYSGDKGNSLVLLYAGTPYIVGFASAITWGFGMPIAWLGLAWVAARHQSTRDGDAEMLYTSRRLQTAPAEWYAAAEARQKQQVANLAKPGQLEAAAPAAATSDSVSTQQAVAEVAPSEKASE